MNKIELKKIKPKNIISKIKNSKKFFTKKKIIFLIIGVVVIYGVVSKVFYSKPITIKAESLILGKTNIVNSVNVLGQIKSDNSTNVYTSSSGVVKEVKVKVGDNVKTGDVLAILDTEKINEEIQQLEEKITSSEASNKLDLDSKQKAYNNVKYLNDNNLNTEIVNAASNLQSTKVTLQDAEKLYEYNKTIFGYGEISNQELKKSENEYNKAKDDYNKAIVESENAKLKAQQDLENAQNSYESAKLAYENKGDRSMLESKKKELEACTIKAPADGTITNVNAVIGNASTGTLFVIEDLSKLIVKASIKEVDIPNVKVGQKTMIKTDATENMELSGEISQINPTAKGGADVPTEGGAQSAGATASSAGDVTFDAKVNINDTNENIKIGMKARLNIILDEKKDVFAVPHESIVENEQGCNIYVAEPIENNKYIIKEVHVNKGLESDFNIEIQGDELKEGMKVLSDPSNYTIGSIVELNGGKSIEG